MAQSFTCENLHSYLFWIHTHCTCIKLYKLPLDQKTGLQKNRYKTPMKSLPPPFFPLPNFFSVKRKGQPGVSKKNLWCGIRIPMYRPVNKGCGLQSLKIYNFSFKKKIYPGTLSRSQSLWMICGFGWVKGEMFGCVLSCRSKVCQQVHWWEIEGPDRTSFTYFQIKKIKYSTPYCLPECLVLTIHKE